MIEHPWSATNRAWLLNERAAAYLGLGTPEEAVGKTIRTPSTSIRVAGVVKDYHQSGLQAEIEPMVMRINPHSFSKLSIRVRPGSESEAYGLTEQTWGRFSDNRPFEAYWLADNYNRLYDGERKLGNTLVVAAAIALTLAMLGVIGMIAFATQAAIRQIGIRKVLGATESGLVLLFTNGFMKLILISNILALPLAYYAGSHWLERFASRTSLELTTFIALGFALSAVGLAIASVQTWRAARLDPVQALKHD